MRMRITAIKTLSGAEHVAIDYRCLKLLQQWRDGDNLNSAQQQTVFEINSPRLPYHCVL